MNYSHCHSVCTAIFIRACMLIAKSSQMDDFLTLSSVFLQTHSKILTNGWFSDTIILWVHQLSLQRHMHTIMIAKSSQMDEFLTLSFCVYSYFYKGIFYQNPHKWKNFLTRYDSMHPALTIVSRATPLNQKGKRGLVTACTGSCIGGMQ